jgi:hypothetical protein
MTAGFKWDELSIPYTKPFNDARKMADSPVQLSFFPLASDHSSLYDAAKDNGMKGTIRWDTT